MGMKTRMGSIISVALLITPIFFWHPGPAGSAASAGGGENVTMSTAGVTLSADFDNSYIEDSVAGERYLQILVTADDTIPATLRRERPPLNISLVIDRSGSMAGRGKLQYVKKAAREMIDRLQYGDRFSLVAYDNRVDVLIPSEALEDRSRAKALIDRLAPRGGTNLGGGMLEGYRQVKNHLIPGGVNRVLLLSDGLANKGITSPAELSRRALIESERGVSISTFGVGSDFNEDLMAALSENGRGSYYYIDRPGEIPAILAREFSSAAATVALGMTISIDLRDDIEISEVLGYGVERRGSSITLRVGDLASGERRRFMIRFHPPRLSLGSHSAGTVRMSYQPTGSSEHISTTGNLNLRYVEDTAAVKSNLNSEVAERTAVYEAHEARKKAAQALDRGDRRTARKVLDRARDLLKSSPVQSDRVRQELQETEDYGVAVDKPLSTQERSIMQKEIKYDAEMNYGC